MHLSADGQITGEFSTLMNLGRDVGLTLNCQRSPGF